MFERSYKLWTCWHPDDERMSKTHFNVMSKYAIWLWNVQTYSNHYQFFKQILKFWITNVSVYYELKTKYNLLIYINVWVLKKTISVKSKVKLHFSLMGVKTTKRSPGYIKWHFERAGQVTKYRTVDILLILPHTQIYTVANLNRIYVLLQLPKNYINLWTLCIAVNAIFSLRISRSIHFIMQVLLFHNSSFTILFIETKWIVGLLRLSSTLDT